MPLAVQVKSAVPDQPDSSVSMNSWTTSLKTGPLQHQGPVKADDVSLANIGHAGSHVQKNPVGVRPEEYSRSFFCVSLITANS